MKKFVIIICSLVIVGLMTSCNLVKSNNNKTKISSSNSEDIYYSEDKAVSLNYNSGIWEPTVLEGGSNVIGIIGKDSNSTAAIIQVKKYSETFTEAEYVDSLIKTYKSNEVKGTTTVSKLSINGDSYSLLHSQAIKGKNTLNYDVLIIMNGKSQYEFSFQAAGDNYAKYKNEAMNVFETLKVLKKDTSSDLAGIKNVLDSLDGIDSESVKNNITEFGPELVGSWVIKQTDGSSDIRLIMEKSGDFKKYKQYPDEKSIMTGTWEYSSDKSVLKMYVKKAIDNDKDIMATIDEYPEYGITSFKDDTLKVININTQMTSVYTKVASN